MAKLHQTAVAVILTTAGLLSSCETDVEAGAIEAVRAHEAASVSKNVEAVLDTFATDAVVVGHPLDADGGDAQGHTEIRPLEEESLSFALDEAGFEYLDIVA